MRVYKESVDGSTLYSLGSGKPYTYNGITPTQNVGAHARCHRCIYNFSRIERRIQQQKRYLYQYVSYYFLADNAKIKVFFEIQNTFDVQL